MKLIVWYCITSKLMEIPKPICTISDWIQRGKGEDLGIDFFYLKIFEDVPTIITDWFLSLCRFHPNGCTCRSCVDRIKKKWYFSLTFIKKLLKSFLKIKGWQVKKQVTV